MRLKEHRQRRLLAREVVPPRAIFVSGGIGDVLALSCFLNLPATVDTIYYASRKSDDLAAFFALLTPNQTQHVSLWDDWSEVFAWYSLAEFVRVTKRQDISDAVDWSITSVFPRLHPEQFAGLPWLSGHPLSSVHDLALPERYAVLAPFSSDKRDARRDFSRAEIAASLAMARAADMPLVLLNSGDDPPLAAAGLIDLQNRTNLYGSIDITLGASLFIGIDSAMSVVASKVLPAERLCIKTVNEHCRRWQAIYFAPHRSFEFLTADPTSRLKEMAWTA